MKKIIHLSIIILVSLLLSGSIFIALAGSVCHNDCPCCECSCDCALLACCGNGQPISLYETGALLPAILSNDFLWEYPPFLYREAPVRGIFHPPKLA